ncbi:helix-turn-helix transcriptional regulator, partial [Escherichia coli]|uniref:helix-turn-helix transcriptional regulator n=4 Tax=Enterobacterales TaxID=91347 RepID=UPI003CCBC01F
WKPPAHSPEENMVRQKCSGIRRSYLAVSNIGLNKFSVYMGCREQEIVELLNGSVSLTKAMALRLSHVVGGSWSKWMLIQEQFELQLAQREIKELMILTNIGDEVVGL